MIKILNVRLGLATNSSSSHSIVFLRPGQQLKERYSSGEQFGWNWFLLTTKPSKELYLAVQLRDALEETLKSPELVNEILQAWLGLVPPDDVGIDHQSVFALPLEYNTNVPDRQFVADLREFMLRDNVAILGGNDNDRDGEPRETISLPHKTYPVTDCHSPLVARKNGRVWTLFNPKNGGKLRFTFDAFPEDTTSFSDWAIPELTIANRAYAIDAPELIDLKITDFCPFGCKFCYQFSTHAGKHAEYTEIYRILGGLSAMKVFEVAIGGGEPTLHPDFVHILKRARDFGIVPNFTTRNLAWLHDPRQRDPIMDYAGAFAYTVQKADEISKLITILDYAGIDHDRAHIHVVLGTLETYQFRDIVETVKRHHLPLTLLGYKHVGRGKAYEKLADDWWLKEIQKADLHRVSIDTALASIYEADLQQADIPRLMYETQDGLSSAYIDAVNLTIAPSSYTGKAISLVTDGEDGDIAETIKKHFLSWQPKGG